MRQVQGITSFHSLLRPFADRQQKKENGLSRNLIDQLWMFVQQPEQIDHCSDRSRFAILIPGKGIDPAASDYGGTPL